MKGFIPELDAIPSWDLQCAEQLKKALMKGSKILSEPNVVNWSGQFGKLRRTYGEKRVKTVLDWFCSNLKSDHLPEAYSAESFRKKFERIEKAMNRTSILPEEDITDEAKTISILLGGLHWPDKETEQELQCIQLTLNSYNDFLTKLKKLRDLLKSEKDDSGYRRIVYIQERLNTPQTFVRNYMNDLHQLAHNWKEWNGNLLSFVFSVDSTYADKMLCGLMQEYTGNGSDWFPLKRKVMKV